MTDVVSAAVACGSAVLYLHHEVVEPAELSVALQADLPTDVDGARRAVLRELEPDCGLSG